MKNLRCSGTNGGEYILGVLCVSIEYLGSDFPKASPVFQKAQIRAESTMRSWVLGRVLLDNRRPLLRGLELQGQGREGGLLCVHTELGERVRAEAWGFPLLCASVGRERLLV